MRYTMIHFTEYSIRNYRNIYENRRKPLSNMAFCCDRVKTEKEINVRKLEECKTSVIYNTLRTSSSRFLNL